MTLPPIQKSSNYGGTVVRPSEETPSKEQCWEEFWKVAAYVLANIERRRRATHIEDVATNTE